MYKLSICMMVKNEEKNLKRCLDSIKPIVEDGTAELIIVDTGSSDKTIDIAKQYTDKVYSHLWNNNFSDMRNITISYAKGKWIFILDADEKVEDIQKLKKILSKSQIKINNTLTVEVKNVNNFKNKNNLAINFSPRIFKNDGNFKYLGAVHNQPIYKHPVYNTNVSLLHYGYILGDKELMNKKFLRTKSILQNELKKNPNSVYYQFQLGVSYDMHGDCREGLVEYKKAYNILKNSDHEQIFNRAYVYGGYTRCLYENNKYNEVIKLCKEGIKLREDYIDLYFLLAMAQKNQGNYQESEKYFLKYFKLISNIDNLDISKDLSITLYNIDQESKDNAHFALSQIYIYDKRYDKAYDNVNLVKDKIKRNMLMPKVLVKLNNIDVFKKYYDEIKKDDEIKNYFLNNLQLEISKLSLKEKYELYSGLSSLEDEYGLYCSIKILKDEQKILASKEFLSKFDFTDKPLFYSEVFKEVIKNDRYLFDCFKKISLYNLRNIVNYLLNQFKECKGIFEEYLLNWNIRPNDVASNKVYIALSYTVLTYNYEQDKVIDNKKYTIFKRYVDSGINYVFQLYKMEKARIIYKQVSNNEDKFFMLMYLIKCYISKSDIRGIIKYLKETLICNKGLITYIEKYKEEVLNFVDKGEYYE